jgi:DNA-binding NarL/FixJ family response regulator
MAISVLVADANARLAGVLAQLLEDEPAFEVVGVVDTAAATLLAARARRPSAVLVDHSFPDGTGEAVCAALRVAVPGAVLLLWSHDIERTQATAPDVDAVLERGMTFRELVGALLGAHRRLARGRA